LTIHIEDEIWLAAVYIKRFKVRIDLFVLLTLFSISALSKQIDENDTLVFVVNAPGSPPYLYYDLDSQSYQGVVVDFFSQLEEKDILVANFIDSNRGRSEKFIIEGTADMMLTSRSWLDTPERLIFTNKISVHQSYLYSLSPFEPGFVLQSAKGMRVCTRRGFIYPGLDSYFETIILLGLILAVKKPWLECYKKTAVIMPS